jgi:hypothetical protein
MADAGHVAEEFFSAWTSKDFDRAPSVSAVFDARPFAPLFESTGH